MIYCWVSRENLGCPAVLTCTNGPLDSDTVVVGCSLVHVGSRKVEPYVHVGGGVSNPRSANGHRRRQIRRRVLAAYTHCALCGEPVDKTLPIHDPGAAEVDEIIPVSLGGDPLRWSNVQLAHRLCNQRKGNGTRRTTPTVTPTAEPLTSRAW